MSKQHSVFKRKVALLQAHGWFRLSSLPRTPNGSGLAKLSGSRGHAVNGQVAEASQARNGRPSRLASLQYSGKVCVYNIPKQGGRRTRCSSIAYSPNTSFPPVLSLLYIRPRTAPERIAPTAPTNRSRPKRSHKFNPSVYTTSRFDFSGGRGLVRPNKNLIASTTLDIMRGQGMKYAHAISDARQGVEGDLEKSKRQIKRYKETVC